MQRILLCIWYTFKMPGKNAIKSYIENGFYHIYNRGVEKRTIFQDKQDYRVFLHYLKLYLSPPDKTKGQTVKINNTIFKTPRRPLNNYHQKLELLAYCLMPNHFHLLVKQKKSRTIEFFMRSLLTKYSVYFNKRYDRVGSLFQGPYKAVLVENDNQLLHLSRYIHLNPYAKDSPLHLAYSSYADYLGIRKTSWHNSNTILSFFKTAQKTSLKDVFSYQSFVEQYSKEQISIEELAIDMDVKENP